MEGVVGGDLSGELLGPSRCVEILGHVASEDASDDGEREGYEAEEAEDDHDGPEGQSGGGAVHDGDGIDPSEDDGKWEGEEEGREDDAVDPLHASHLLVEGRGNVAADERAGCVEDEHAREERTPLGGADESYEGGAEQEDDGNGELDAGALAGGEEHLVFGEPEDVAVD